MVILDEFVFSGIGRIGTVLAVLRRGGKGYFSGDNFFKLLVLTI